MSLIELNPDFSKVLKQLIRIADAFEQFLLLQFNYDSAIARAQKSALGGGMERIGPQDVTYSTNEQTAELELRAAKKGLEDIRDEPESDDPEDEMVSYS